MSTATMPTPLEKPTTGPRVELATYTTHTGEHRALIGQRVDGVPRVTDEPAHGDGRRYLVEAHLQTKAELDALVADYLAKAERLGYAPMHGWF